MVTRRSPRPEEDSPETRRPEAVGAEATLTAPELILSLLDSATEPRLGAARLVAAGALLGIDSGALRVALLRLVRKRVLAQERRGVYRVGTRGGRLHRAVLGWADVEDQICAWDGSWIGVFSGHLPRSQKVAVRARERALRLRGFATVETGLAVRPANLRAGMDALRDDLLELGLDDGALVLHIGAEDPQRAIDPERLWDRASLERGYQAHLDALRASTARLPALDTAAAARESLLVGRAVMRAILLDPLLPDALVDAGLRRRVIDAMVRYDKLGKSCWRAFYRSLG